MCDNWQLAQEKCVYDSYLYRSWRHDRDGGTGCQGHTERAKENRRCKDRETTSPPNGRRPDERVRFTAQSNANGNCACLLEGVRARYGCGHCFANLHIWRESSQSPTAGQSYQCLRRAGSGVQGVPRQGTFAGGS